MNVYDKAHELARGMKESTEYAEYRSAKELVFSDEKNKGMLGDFKQRQHALQTSILAGQKPDDKQLQELQNLYNIIAANTDLQRFLDAELTLDRLLADIYRIVGEAVEVDYSDLLK